ncbi:DUF7848 domain-containing protein [Streptomyces sp. BBFR109]|uniref:DUF7848 domain-containing protein n=1 Tax=Streptomyces sp. BBFR109 TaxID=3448172 RepID=UPI003F757746
MSGPHTVLAFKRWHPKSASDGAWEPPRTWALGHSGKNPSHLGFEEIITRPWRPWTDP